MTRNPYRNARKGTTATNLKAEISHFIGVNPFTEQIIYLYKLVVGEYTKTKLNAACGNLHVFLLDKRLHRISISNTEYQTSVSSQKQRAHASHTQDSTLDSNSVKTHMYNALRPQNSLVVDTGKGLDYRTHRSLHARYRCSILPASFNSLPYSLSVVSAIVFVQIGCFNIGGGGGVRIVEETVQIM